MTITFTRPKLETSITEQVIIDWISDLDDVNCISYSLDDRGIYFTFYTYDYETQEAEQACYTPNYFTLGEVFSGSIELKALYEYLLLNNKWDGMLFVYEGTTLRDYP